MRKPIVAGNWKMNGTLESIRELVAGLKAGIGEVNVAEVVVCAPAIYIAEASALTGGTAIALGSQDLSNAASGAYTGEISGSMLNDFNCQYAIVGHSERRHGRGESDQLVAEKFKAAQDSGLTPILCIGELLEEREEGVTEQVCARQMDAVINAYGVAALQNSVIAYEPVWAIGTGKTATPEQAQEVHAFIRGRIAAQNSDIADKMRILYGGSMKGSNAPSLISMDDIDGGLIGGASLKASEFIDVCSAAD